MSDAPSARIRLKANRDKSVQNRHPWVFSGALGDIEGNPEPGDLVTVCSANGQFLAQGFYNPTSQIALRLVAFRKEPIDREFWRERLARALNFRAQFVPQTNAMRLIHGEADGFPGLVVDRYGDALTLQITSLGMARMRPLLLELLHEALQPSLIVERSESPSLKEEGMEPVRAIHHGDSTLVEVHEYGVRFGVDLMVGQKTGFFIDQRENRQLIGRLAAGKRLLNCFSYTGGFSLTAALQGAHTTSVEISEPAQAQAQDNFRRNGLNPDDHRFVAADVFGFLRQAQPEYDVIVLDPPAFMKSKNHLKQGTQAYKDINRLAMRQSIPDGLLLSCSCSHFLDWDLFQKILFSAAVESGRQVQILGRLSQPADHPVSLFHPEGEYLKAFLLRVV